MRIGWPGLTSKGPCTRCWSRYVPLVEPRSSTYHWPLRLVSRACRELAKSSVSTRVESSARPMRIGWSPSVIFVPVSGPAVTTRVLGAPRAFFFPGVAARGGTEDTRPGRPPNRSGRTTRKAAKMNSHNSRRKPKRKICRTISAVTRPPRRRSSAACRGVLCSCVTSRARSRPVLPVDQHRVADADDVAVGERLTGDPPAVDEGAVGRAEVLGDRRPAVQDDVDVLAADPGVGEPDVGVGAAADDVAPGGQLVPRARAVDQE